VIIEGNLPGSEVWSNRWTVQETDVASDINDALVAFHTLYAAWSGLMVDDWNVVRIAGRNLATGLVVDYSFVPIDGGSSTDPLPTECAIRISLTGTGGRHGGPFIAGFSSTFTDGQGQLDSTNATAMRNGLNALVTDLAAADFVLRMDSPTTTQTVALTQARLGRTFDVIRKRRNNVAEAYLPVTL
jgi:hypothetical protein